MREKLGFLGGVRWGEEMKAEKWKRMRRGRGGECAGITSRGMERKGGKGVL